MAVIDEQMLDKNHDYDQVSAIYNQLMNNYQSGKQLDAASHFIVGEMEIKRKALLNGNIYDKSRSIVYSLANGYLYTGKTQYCLYLYGHLFLLLFLLS
jgi:hypothetical protein